jgi:hypothetical protein
MTEQKHWLVRPETIRKLWIGGFVILAITVIAEFFIELHPHFTIEGSFGFNAWFGLATCVAMVVAAKVLGVMLKRADTYYEPEDDNDGGSP